MNIIPRVKEDNIKTNTELVQQEKTVKLLATYLVRNGLKLYAYSRNNDTIKEVKIKHGDCVYLVSVGNGKYDYIDPERLKCNVDSKDIHFEALNIKTATIRVNRYKEGKIAELCNLRKASDGSKIKSIYQN